VAGWALITGVAGWFSRVGSAVQILERVTKSGGFSLVLAALVTLLGYSEGLYREGLPRQGVSQEFTLGKSVIFAALIAGIASVLSGWTMVPLPWYVTGVILNFLALCLRRQWRMHRRMRQCDSRPLNVLIVGEQQGGLWLDILSGIPNKDESCGAFWMTNAGEISEYWAG